MLAGRRLRPALRPRAGSRRDGRGRRRGAPYARRHAADTWVGRAHALEYREGAALPMSKDQYTRSGIAGGERSLAVRRRAPQNALRLTATGPREFAGDHPCSKLAVEFLRAGVFLVVERAPHLLRLVGVVVVRHQVVDGD